MNHFGSLIPRKDTEAAQESIDYLGTNWGNKTHLGSSLIKDIKLTKKRNKEDFASQKVSHRAKLWENIAATLNTSVFILGEDFCLSHYKEEIGLETFTCLVSSWINPKSVQ